MTGSGPETGVIPLAMEDIFKYISDVSTTNIAELGTLFISYTCATNNARRSWRRIRLIHFAGKRVGAERDEWMLL